MPWTFIAIGLAALVLPFLYGVTRAFTEERLGRRALRAARAGHLAGLPMRLVPVRSNPRWPGLLGGHAGRAYRDGADLVVLLPRRAARLELADLTVASVRTTLDEETESVREVFALVDADGLPHELQVPEHVGPALAALHGTPAPPVTMRDRLVSAVPWTLVLAALVLVLPLAVHQAAWLTGHDVAATVTEVDTEGGYCTVAWTEGGSEHVATLDCYEPYPAEGSQLTIRAMSGPLTGQAMDYEGSWEAGLVLLGGPVVVALLAAALLTVLRLRGRPFWLQVPRSGAGGEPTGASGAVGSSGAAGVRGRPVSPVLMGMRELAVEVAKREGWASGIFGTEFAYSPLQRLRLAAVLWPLYVAGGALGVGWLLPEEVPQPWSWPLTGVAAAAVLYAVVATGRTLRRMLEPAGDSRTRAVELVTVRTVEDEWLVLVFEPGAEVPGWLLAFGAEARPPLTAVGEVRGVLEEDRAVRLFIDGESWEPAGPVAELDDEFRRELREDLLDRLSLPSGGAWWERTPAASS